MAEGRGQGDRGPVLCEYFVTCQRPAEGTVVHPVAGTVPICPPCSRLALAELTPFPAVP